MIWIRATDQTNAKGTGPNVNTKCWRNRHHLYFCFAKMIGETLGQLGRLFFCRCVTNLQLHIYTSLGMWDEVITANQNAVRVSEESMQRAGKSIANRSKHSLSWLQYALMQEGRFDEARETMVTMREDLAEVENGYHLRHNVLMRSAYIAEVPTAEQILELKDVSELSLDKQGT